MNSIQQKINSIQTDDTYESIVGLCADVISDLAKSIYGFMGTECPEDSTLLELINSAVVTSFVGNDDVIQALHFIRILGSHAKHGRKIKKREAELAKSNATFFYDFVSTKLAGQTVLCETAPYMTEAMTRKIYIDRYLEEAGWEVLEREDVLAPGKASVEIKVNGMPNGKGTGYCDYVLYDNDGKPLAIVEAKKTSVDPVKGRHQLELYGECMKRVYGYTPVLYYSNGYTIKTIDGMYPDRLVAGFHSLKELQLLIRRRSRGDITDLTINPNITDRPYQKIAITRICEHFNSNRRRGLLVMATGTGKTRVAISLVDVLSRNNWVKNVLFLADRTSLVSQARKNFAKLLPNMSVCELSGSGEKDMNARLMFSTYQTMINYIDAEEKEFSVGRFDLIIIDEAHRSIFNKYSSIFKYFDSMLVGLTATPKDEVDSNTYSIFGCESGIPNFDYSLEEAVKDGYLVPYKVNNRTTKLYNRGAKYKELTEEEQKQLEEYILEKGETPEVVATKSELYKKLYNVDTCRKILEEVMNYGVPIDGGETLGKTIIFAYNHKHAQLIVDTFNEMYPEKGKNNYCQLIDNYVTYANDLIDKFEAEDDFRIAVSVDMLDTGVDVPSVCNLVFFKPVKSKIKFMQMIGRGTRLCKNLYGTGKDKTHFLIFDYCGNFEYFDQHPDGIDPKQVYSITQKLFDTKLDLLYGLQKLEYQLNPYTKSYYDVAKSELISQVKRIKLHTERIQVREEMAFVDKFCDDSVWQSVSAVDIAEIKNHLTKLIESGLSDKYKILSFDSKMMDIQNALISEGSIEKTKTRVKTVRLLAKFLLEEKSSIPEVLSKVNELKTLMDESFWISPTFESLEEMRLSVRNVMQYAVSDNNNWEVDIDDQVEEGEIPGSEFGWIDIRTYREKVIDYLIANSQSEAIRKIKELEPITYDDLRELERVLWEELGTKNDYHNLTQNDNVAVFVRSLVGLDQAIINKKFGEYLSGGNYNSMQQEFIRTIINYVRENGDITKEDLITTSPFDNYDLLGLFGDRVAAVINVVSMFHDSISVAA